MLTGRALVCYLFILGGELALGGFGGFPLRLSEELEDFGEALVDEWVVSAEAALRELFNY